MAEVAGIIYIGNGDAQWVHYAEKSHRIRPNGGTEFLFLHIF